MNLNFESIGAAIVGILFALANYSITTILGAEILARGSRVVAKVAVKLTLLALGVLVCLYLSSQNVVVALVFYLLTLLVLALRTTRSANYGAESES